MPSRRRWVSFDLGRLTALPLNRLYFGRSYTINLEAEPGVRGFVERDPCGPHTQNFGNQRREIGDVPAIGAGENPLQGGLLLVVAAIVKDGFQLVARCLPRVGSGTD